MSAIEAVYWEWVGVCREIGITSPSWIQSEWLKILPAYTDAKRHYHDLRHIAYVLTMAHEYQHLAEDFIALKYALIRHDEKYLAYARHKGLPTNEALSAAIADEALAELNQQKLVEAPITMKFRERVCGNINATHHSDIYRPQTKDEMLVADIDWSPLGIPWPKFLRNRRQIRAEYSEYTDKEFVSGRTAFISALKEREKQFYLPEFRERFEARVHENILQEEILLTLPWEKQAAIMAAA